MGYAGSVKLHTVHGNQHQERITIMRKIAKIITIPDTRNGSPQILLCTASWYLSHQGKHNTVNAFTHIEKRESKINYKSGYHSPTHSQQVFLAVKARL